MFAVLLMVPSVSPGLVWASLFLCGPILLAIFAPKALVTPKRIALVVAVLAGSASLAAEVSTRILLSCDNFWWAIECWW